MRRESMEQKMNRPGLVTRRPDPTSLSPRRRRATLRVILLPLDIVESADPVPVPAVDEVAPFLPACISAPSATGDDGPHARLLAFRHSGRNIHLSAGRRPGRHNARRPAVLHPSRVLTSRVGVNGWVHTCEAHLRGRSRLSHPALRGNRVDPDTYRKAEEARRC